MSALLDFVKYSYCNTWSVHLLLENTLLFSNKYPLVYFKEFTKKANIETIHIKNDETYKILGVRSYGLGVYLNREILGSTLTMRKYQKAKKNHLFWCKVDTKNGAFGIIPEELEDGLGSSNMTFAELDTQKIDVNYLQLFFKSKRFNTYMDGQVVGTTNRKYIKFNDLLNEIKIPLPKLNIQKQIVENYQNKINLANKQEQKAKDLEKDIEEYLYSELGLNTTSKQTDQLLNFAQFLNLSRWDIGFLLDNNISHSKYDLIPINSVINKFLKNIDNSSLRFDSSKYPDLKFNYIGMENIEKESGNLLKLDEVNGIDIKSQTIKLPKKFFLYGKLRPYLNKYFFNDLESDNIIVSSEFFVFSVKNINEQYFKYILSSSFVQSQIENHMKGARMPRISEETFRNLVIPFPSIETQNKIVKHILELKDNIKMLNQESKYNKILALEKFEKEVFNENK